MHYSKHFTPQRLAKEKQGTFTLTYASGNFTETYYVRPGVLREILSEDGVEDYLKRTGDKSFNIITEEFTRFMNVMDSLGLRVVSASVGDKKRKDRNMCNPGEPGRESFIMSRYGMPILPHDAVDMHPAQLHLTSDNDQFPRDGISKAYLDGILESVPVDNLFEAAEFVPLGPQERTTVSTLPRVVYPRG